MLKTHNKNILVALFIGKNAYIYFFIFNPVEIYLSYIYLFHISPTH